MKHIITTTPPHFAEVETFLQVNSQEIDPKDRAHLRAIAMRSILDSSEPNLKRCPDHLRDHLRRLIIAAAYRLRVQGQMYNPKKPCMPC